MSDIDSNWEIGDEGLLVDWEIRQMSHITRELTISDLDLFVCYK